MRHRCVQRLAGLVALGVLLAPAVAFADYGKDAKEHDHVDRRVEMLKKKLSLTDDQTGKVRSILESSQQASQQAMEAMHSAMQQRKEQTDQQILAVLNDQQKAQYAKIQEERKKKRDEHKNKNGGWFHRHKEES